MLALRSGIEPQQEPPLYSKASAVILSFITLSGRRGNSGRCIASGIGNVERVSEQSALGKYVTVTLKRAKPMGSL
jgi:hypothetical protein